MKKMISAVFATVLCISTMNMTVYAEENDSFSAIVDTAISEAMQTETAIPVRITFYGPEYTDSFLNEVWDLSKAEIAAIETEGLSAVEIETKKCKYYVTHYMELVLEGYAADQDALFTALDADTSRGERIPFSTKLNMTLSPEEIEAAAKLDYVYSIELQEESGSRAYAPISTDVQKKIDAGEELIPVVMFYDNIDVSDLTSLYYTLPQNYVREYVDYEAFTSSEREMIWVNAASDMKSEVLKEAATYRHQMVAQELGLTEDEYGGSLFVGVMNAQLTPEQIEKASSLSYMKEITLFTPLEAEPTTPDSPSADYMSGDINDDGAVDAADAAEILVESALIGAGNGGEFTHEQNIAGDVNGDGKIDASDAAVILVYAAEIGAGNNVKIEDCVN